MGLVLRWVWGACVGGDAAAVAAVAGGRRRRRVRPALPQTRPGSLTTLPRTEQDALLALIPGATLTTYPDTGHAPHWERPEAVARDLARFLRRVRGAP